MSQWFNSDQVDYMRSLGEIPPESKCWCGWYSLGECPHCPAGYSSADKIKAWCPECHNDPGPKCDRPITHRIGCSFRTPAIKPHA
jgi:hypothetical protein